MEESTNTEGADNSDTQIDLDAPTQLLVLEESNQDMFENSDDPVLESVIMDSSNSEAANIQGLGDVSTKNKDADQNKSIIDLTLLSSRTSEDHRSTLTSVQESADTSGSISTSVEPLVVKRKFLDDAGNCGQRKLQKSDEAPLSPIRTASPLSAALTKIRSSPRTKKRSNSCSLECCADAVVKPSPRLRRIASSDSSPQIKDANVNLSRLNISERIDEEDISDSFKLQFSPFGFSQDEEPVSRLRHMTSSEPVPTPPKESEVPKDKAHSAGYNYSDQNARNSQSVKGAPATDQDSTASIESPADFNPLTSKMMSHLSNGYSSTPENIAPVPDINHPSDNNEANKNNTRTPSTISPFINGNGHSSLPVTTPAPPVFDLQIGYDDNGDFMSLLVVRTDIDSGSDMCKELQRISRRFTMDPYFADVSKSTSPSSVVSSIPSHHRASFTSSCSSSSSSTRTTDGAFVVPQPPKKSLSSQGPMNVKGFKALSQRVNEILVQLAEIHGAELSNTSSTATQSNLSNGSASAEEVEHRATPKSSLKKQRSKGRRPMSSKTKRAILPPTSEEEQEFAEGMHSPEMVPTESDAKRTASPVYDEVCKDLVIPLEQFRQQVAKRGRPRLHSPARPKTPITPKVAADSTTYCPGTVVLAKWADKRYYSGKVTQTLDVNKYLIEFDDGHSKTLLDDFIIFGNMKELPLCGQSVYALVDEDQNYEPGLVLAIDENEHGTVRYICTTDRDMTVSVVASEIYVTEDQARAIKETRPQKSPCSTPTTPRRRGNRELDLDNIIQGPRSVRSRDKPCYTPSKKGKNLMPASPEASTSSGIRGAGGSETSRAFRHASESSEVSEGGAEAEARSERRFELVAGVEPEVQKTPRKADGAKAGPLHLKGAARQNPSKKSSKIKSESEDMIATLGPIPHQGSTLFSGLCFLLTCAGQAKTLPKIKKDYGSSCDSQDSQEGPGTDFEDREFAPSPFIKERIREQIEAGGGTVYSQFEDIPKKKYNACRLIAPRPCLTAKYIQCLAVDIRAVTHVWVARCCTGNQIYDYNPDALPSGWSIEKETFIRWRVMFTDGRRSAIPFKDKQILLCSDSETFTLFWERVCTLAGANTRIVNDEDLNMNGGQVVVTDCDCSHQVQNKAAQDNIPLVSTTWVVQCLIEGRMCSPTAHPRYLFSYTEAD